MRVKKSPVRVILLSFLGIFLADAIITEAFGSYLNRHKYHGDLIPDFIPIIISAAIAVAVGLALFFRFRGKISAASLSKLGIVVSVVVLLICVSTCVSSLYEPATLIFQDVASPGWWAVDIPSIAHLPAEPLYVAAKDFVQFICGGKRPGGILGSFPWYVYDGTRDFMIIVCSFGAAYFIYRLHQTFTQIRQKPVTATANELKAAVTE